MPGFPRERRVHRAAEIRAILAGGRRADGPNLRLHALVESQSVVPVRAAIVVPRFGRTAVARNRLKRRLRELVRLHVLDAAELRGVSLVIRARAGAYSRDFAELRSELLGIVRRLATVNAAKVQ